MKIGLIGRGSVVQALARRLALRHESRFGVRAPASQQEGTLAEVARWADVVIVTTPWRAAAEVAQEIGPVVQGKPVLDATNPVAMAPHGPDFSEAASPSAAAAGLQAALPEAHVVKCFNQIGAEFMADPTTLASRPVMFAAGDDAAAKETALTLIEDAGFEAVDAGPLANARHLESLALLWIWQATKGALGRRFGFALTHQNTKGTPV